MGITSYQQVIAAALNWDKILVTGVQRSGTTIAAYMLAKALEYKFVDENEFHAHNIEEFNSVMNTDEKCVIQCPALLHYIKRFDSSALVVVMDRDKEDVIASMNKHNWFNDHGLFEYRHYSEEPLTDPPQIIDIKLNYAENVKHMKLRYEDLTESEYFIYDRNNWQIKQIQN
jgi:hypothetical protein